MIIFLSGSITNCLNDYKQIFDDKKKELEEQGHIVINPAVLPDCLDKRRYMPVCLNMIEGADAIYMFNDWQNSKGALLEKAYAEYQGKPVLYD